MPDHAILGHTVTAAEIGARIAEQHPLSAIFPAMTAADFAQLRGDIAQTVYGSRSSYFRASP